MINKLKHGLAILAVLTVFSNCKKASYSLGDLTPPADVVITATPVGQDATHPNGDGSGNVKISVAANYALSYKIQYSAGGDMVYVPTGSATHKYTTTGVNTYTITAVVGGKGGTTTTATKDVTVQSDFTPDPDLVTNLTGDAAKTWAIDKDVAGHFGVGPYSNTSVTPEWYQAAPNEKAACCACFYSATFTFTKVAANSYTMTVTTPDGAFTKTGALTTLPGIPAAGDEGCYSYSGGTSAFSLVPASTGIAAPTSTGTSILLAGNNTFIGYGAVLKEYEIMTISANSIYLRVQGTETGNAWYMRLKAI